MAGPTTTLQTGVHASRPAASAGCVLYSCTTHSLIYRSDGSAWTTWATLTGTGLSDPMTTRGDIIYRDSSNVTNRLAIPAAGQVVGRSGSDLAAVYPPGYELDYVATTTATITATSEATANTVVTGSAIAYDGSTVVMIEFFCPKTLSSGAGKDLHIYLYDGSGSIGEIGYVGSSAGSASAPVHGFRRLTPSNATHTYSIRASVDTSGTGFVVGGAGGSGASMPLFIRITRV